MNKKIVFLLLILAVAYFLRVVYLRNGAITFAYDQARDAFVAEEIAKGDFKILGPSVSGVPGFFHGVLYYYVISALYYFGNGNPVFVAYVLSLINSLILFIVYLLTKKMFKREFPALLAATFYAVSFEQTQYASWLSNPAMGVWFVPLIYFGLYMWVSNSKNIIYLVMIGFFYGLSVQSNVSLIYHIVPIGIWLWYKKSLLSIKNILILIVSILLAVSTMIAVEVKFGFRSLEGIKYFLNGQSDLQIKGFGNYLVSYLNHMGGVFANNLFPLIPSFGALLGVSAVLLCLLRLKEKGFKYKTEFAMLLTWVLAFLPASTVAGTNIPHISAGLGVSFIILISFLVWELRKRDKFVAYAIICVVILANAAKIFMENSKGQTIFAIQKDMTLKNELQAVDYTYLNSGKEPYSINTLTSPLYINTTWSYLYSWYGKNKYGYLPYWAGRSQVGQTGDNLSSVPEKVPTRFYIVEPTYGIPERYVNEGFQYEDAVSERIEEINFGEIKVQKRYLK